MEAGKQGRRGVGIEKAPLQKQLHSWEQLRESVSARMEDRQLSVICLRYVYYVCSWRLLESETVLSCHFMIVMSFLSQTRKLLAKDGPKVESICVSLSVSAATCWDLLQGAAAAGAGWRMSLEKGMNCCWRLRCHKQSQFITSSPMFGCWFSRCLKGSSFLVV
jgi:hypothetical protein